MTDNSPQQPAPLVPAGLRSKGFWLSLFFSVVLIAYYVAYIVGVANASPRELGLSNLLLFFLLCFLFFAVPWHQLGWALRRFGPMEFERKLEGQSRERILEIAALEERIAELESAVRQDKGTAAIMAPGDPLESLQEQVIAFLREHDQQAFSPGAVERQCAKEPGYASLADDPIALRRTLRRLVAEDRVVTRVSENGETLFRIRPGNQG